MAEDVKEEQQSFLGDTLVLDLAEGQLGFCSKLLADLGARVIKVETAEGAPGRRMGPLGNGGTGAGSPRGPFFSYHNANKPSLPLDPKGEEGRVILRGLIGQADVLIETFAPGRADALGINPGQVRRINPALIHLSITGFGQAGPRSGFRWCDAVLSAFGGQMYVIGPPSGPPRAMSGGQSLYSSSLFGAVAILLALRERRLTGKGRHIDLSAQEALASTLDHVMVDYFRDHTISRRQGSMYGDGAFAILPCADGHMLLDVLANRETLLELMAAEGREEDLIGGRWRDRVYCETHFDHLVAAVGRWAKGHRKAELFALGQAMRFPWAPVCTLEEVLESPQLAARRFFFPPPAHPGIGAAVAFSGPPYRFRSFSPPPPKAAPRPGERSLRRLEGLDRDRPEKGSILLGRIDGKHYEGSEPVLKGMKVLDFTRMLAGPYATRILADFGAEVIKVESVRAAGVGERADAAYDAAWNRNKRSITLDLDHPEARDIVLRLAAATDVVVESFSPRVMANWGLTYDELRKVRPDVIMASISAMGQTGPWRDYVGLGPTFHALSGLISETSQGLDAPLCPGHAYGDTMIGLYAALAILAALKRRDATGQGEYIDLAGYEALCTLLGPALLGTAADARKGRGEQGCEQERADRAGCYRCLGPDRWCVIAAPGEDGWEALSAVVDLPGLKDDRFSSAEKRRAHRDELDALIGAWTANRTPEEVVDLLQGAGVAAGVVQDAEDLAEDPQLAFRRFFISLTHQRLGTVRSDRSALLLDGLERKEWKAAPLPGEDNDYVFGQLLGLAPAYIRRCRERGIIG
jgi:crotonobetainyl-CoA:carnitine CoA-transferase CaiB-like acyl-CoA transferase